MYKGEELLSETLTANGQGACDLNKALLNDSRVAQVMLPLRDGVTIVHRLESTSALKNGSTTPEDGSTAPEDGNTTPEDGSPTPEDGSDLEGEKAIADAVTPSADTAYAVSHASCYASE